MKLSHSILAAILVLTPITATAQEVCEAGETKITMSLVTSLKGHPKGQTALAMAETVNSQLNGKLCMEVVGNSELYNDDDVFDAILRNDVQMAAPAFSKFTEYTKRLQLFDLPFLFDGPIEILDFLATDAAQALRADVAPVGFNGLGFWSNGMRQVSANKPLRVPSDAAGLIFRSQPSAVAQRQFELIDGIPKVIAFSEVHDALESGEIQGQQNTWSNIYGREFFLHQDGVTETNHSYTGYLVVMAQEFLDSLDADVREEFLEIYENITHEYNRFSYETNQARRQDIIDEGSIVRKLTPEERAQWQATFEPLYREFEPIIGSDLLNAARGIDTDN